MPPSVNGVPIEQLGAEIERWVMEQVAKDHETLRTRVIPECAHIVLARAIQGTNKVKAVHLGAFKLGWRVVEHAGGADVVNDVLYAGVIELGRRPGRPGPPLEPIVEWVRRKLFADQSRPSGKTKSGSGTKGKRPVRFMMRVKRLIKRLVKWIKGKLKIKGAKRKKGEKTAKVSPEQREADIMRIAIAIRASIHMKGTKPRFILRDSIKILPEAFRRTVRRHLPTR